MSQIALPLTVAVDGDARRVVVGNANEAVIAALRDPSGWPFGTAVLTGPERSGKSLLGQWFAGMGGEVLDGADAMDEDAVFHRWNRAQENGEKLLLISDSQPWDISLPDLRSRLGAALQLEIGVPDDEMVGALLETHAAKRALTLGEDAIAYLVPRTERSFVGIEQIVAMIDQLSLERKSRPHRGIWRDALEAVQGPEQARLL